MVVRPTISLTTLSTERQSEQVNIGIRFVFVSDGRTVRIADVVNYYSLLFYFKQLCRSKHHNGRTSWHALFAVMALTPKPDIPSVWDALIRCADRACQICPKNNAHSTKLVFYSSVITTNIIDNSFAIPNILVFYSAWLTTFKLP